MDDDFYTRWEDDILKAEYPAYASWEKEDDDE